MKNTLFYHNSRLTLLVVCLILVSGLSSFMILPRMEDPSLVQRGAFINTLYPGADAELVESLVSEKIEDALNEIEEIKELRSTSREGISTIAIELRDEVLDSDRVWSRIRDKLDDVQGELPQEALKPDFEEMDFKAYALLVALRWDLESEVNFAVLRRWAEELKDRMQSLPGTEEAELIGSPTEEVLVTLDPQRLAALNLTVADVSRQIRASDAKSSAGQIRGAVGEMLIEVAGELKTIQRIENIPIQISDGSFCSLQNVATIEKSVTDPPDSIAIVDGKRAITVGVFVREDSRIDLWQQDIEAALATFSEELPQGVGLARIFDQNEYVASRLSSLVANLMLGGTAVFFVIFFLMGWRNAVVVALALPLAAMMVLFSMRVMEIPIHQMSVTGLIIALGLLIDNAIVIVDEVSTRLREGNSPANAVTASVKHLFLPLLGSTVTTALAFAPIALMPGPAGEFVGSIAINVIVAIFSSFFLAMTILPAISAKLSLLGRNTEGGKSRWWRDGFSNPILTRIYHSVLGFVFRRPAIGVLLGVTLPIFGFVQSRHLKEQFFPPADRDQLHIEMELSADGTLYGTQATTAEMREVLLQDPNVRRVDWFIGESAPAFYYNLIPRKKNLSQYAQALVQLNSADELFDTIHRLQAQLDEQFSHTRVLVRQLEQGPPFDAPVEVRLFGPDLVKLRELGNQVRLILSDIPDVIHSRAELDEVLRKVQLDVDEEEIRAAGISLTEIANQLSASTEGAVGGSIVEATEELPVRVRVGDRDRNSVRNVTSLDLIDSRGAGDSDLYSGIPLSAVADVNLKPEFGSIQHLAGRRMNEVQVYITAGVLPSTVLTELQSRLDEAGFDLPPGYFLRFGGEAAKRDEAVSNLMASVGILMVLMVATLVLSFGSFRVAAIVGFVGLLSIGLGLGALWVFSYPFGFMAIIGSMGLMGVAINDTIVVLAAIRENERARTGDRAEMLKVVSRATRHIISTSLTTMAGFIPLILGGGGFWPPMAIAIAGGVSGATILALVFVPSLYIILMCRNPAPQAAATSPAESVADLHTEAIPA